MQTYCRFILQGVKGEEAGAVRVAEDMTQDDVRMAIYSLCELKRGEVRTLKGEYYTA